MAKFRTADEFSNAITSDLTWRVRELSDLRTIVGQTDVSLRPSILRACIPIVYAHWEGHVCYVAKAYLEFLASQKLRYSKLKRHFLLNEFFSTFRSMRQTTPSHEQQVDFLNKVLDSDTQQFRKANEELVNSGSNLRSKIFKNICCATGVDYSEFENDADFIDKILADRRNNVAHGAFLTISYESFVEVSDRTMGLMRKFNNIVDNDVLLGRYRSA